MTNYIDAEKLKAEIKRYKNEADERMEIRVRTCAEELKDLALQNLCDNLLNFIDSLQLEQQEVDLEKEIAIYFQGFWPGMKTPEARNHQLVLTTSAIMELIEYFFKLGLNTRKEE